MGEGGVKNLEKIADVVYGWSLSSQELRNTVIQLKSILGILKCKALNGKLRSLKCSLGIFSLFLAILSKKNSLISFEVPFISMPL